MSLIEDGKGSGFKAQVNTENQLVVSAITASEIEHESEENGAGYNWNSLKLDLAVGETYLLVKNTSETALHIECIKIANGASATEFTVHLPTTDVTVAGGAVVTGTNLNTTSSNVADADSRSNESGNAIATSNLLTTVFLAINAFATIETPGLILGKNKSIAVDAITEPGTAQVNIVGHYSD